MTVTKNRRSKNDVPAYDSHAEAAVLSCCLQKPAECLPATQDALAPEDFNDVRYRTIFSRLLAMSAARRHIDVVALHSELKLAGELEYAGGAEHVFGLPDVCPSTASLSHYLDLVRRWAAVRQVRETARMIDESAGKHPEQAGIIARHGATSLTEIGERFSVNDEAPKIVDAAELAAQSMEVPPEIIQGVLHRGSKFVLGGGSKSNKTWVLLDMALSVSHGETWLGFPTRKGRVLFVNLEIPRGFFAKRLREISARRGIRIEADQLHTLTLRGHCASYRTLLPEIERKCQGRGFDLIILDPIYKLYGGTDENSAGEVAELLQGVEHLAVKTGAAVAFAAHFSKGNQATKEAIDRISGSGVFARDPDSLMMLTKHEVDGAFTVEATLRNLAPISPFVIRWRFPIMERDEELDPTRLKQPKGRARAFDPNDLRSLLPASGLSLGAWKSRAQDDGISHSTFHRIRRELFKAGRVRHDKVSELWMLA